MRKVVAVVVSWNPEEATIRKMMEAFRNQVDHVIISDNNSKPEVREFLKKIEIEAKGFFTVLWNSDNLGMGGGLNAGAREAIKQNADWILTTEGDNYPQPGAVKTMFTAYDALPPETQAKIGLITPNYTTVLGFAFPDGEPQITNDGGITSCQLVKASILEKVGLWNEEMFIDAVDSEFAFRVYRKGFKTLLVPRAIIQHRLGPRPTKARFLWKTAYVPNYSPYRYYYMARNYTYLYVRHFSEWVLHNPNWYNGIWTMIIPRYLIKAVLFEEKKWEKVRMAALGTWHGLTGKMGRIHS